MGYIRSFYWVECLKLTRLKFKFEVADYNGLTILCLVDFKRKCLKGLFVGLLTYNGYTFYSLGACSRTRVDF